MAVVSLQPRLSSQHQLKHQPFYGTPLTFPQKIFFLNPSLINDNPKSLTRAKASRTRPPPKTRTTRQQRSHNPNPKTNYSRTTFKGKPKRRSGYQHGHVQGKPILRYVELSGQRNLATVYGDIKLLCREGQLDEALTILGYMDFQGEIPVDANIYDILLKGCTDQNSLEGGKQVHSHMKLSGYDRNPYLATKLVQFYTACGSLADAQKTFDVVPERDSFLWNVLIRAYVKNGFQEEKAIELYHQMKFAGFEPDSFTFSCVLKACSSLGDLQQGMEIHADVIRRGFESDAVVGGALVNMYCRCNRTDFACQLFKKMTQRNVVNWTAMISGLVHNQCWADALECFREMVVEGCKPNSVTVSSVLPACGILKARREGKQIHGYITRRKLNSHVFACSALIDMYAKCGAIGYARQVFDKMSERNVVSYSTMIHGYANKGRCEEAFEIFGQMQLESVNPSIITMVNILSVCVDLAALQQVKEIHAYIIKSGFLSNLYVCHSLIDMYSRCGSIEDGRKVFDEIPAKNVICWTTMIAAYNINGCAEEAFTAFHQLLEDGVKPNLVTMLKIIPACSDLAVVQEGQKIHAYAVKTEFDTHVFVSSALIDMYTKCGCIDIAEKVFDNLPERGVISWTAMLAAYGRIRHGKKALKLFNEMQRQDVKLNRLTFSALLTACANAGLVAEGWQYFNSMNQNYHVRIRTEHYACMVELLGRAGQLKEAQNFIENMPIKPHVLVWRSLLGACTNHCNVEVGEYAVERLQNLEPLNAGDFIALARIYAATDKWDDVAKVRTMMKNRGLKGKQEWSGVVIKNRNHKFVRGDKSHPQLEQIYSNLEIFSREIKATEYMPEVNILPHVKEEDEEYILCGHTETLALTFGLMKSSPGIPITIVQNICMCRYCHVATKTISKITGQNIFVRHGDCMHHFKGGECSCGDYWQ